MFTVYGYVLNLNLPTEYLVFVDHDMLGRSLVQPGAIGYDDDDEWIIYLGTDNKQNDIVECLSDNDVYVRRIQDHFGLNEPDDEPDDEHGTYVIDCYSPVTGNHWSQCNCEDRPCCGH